MKSCNEKQVGNKHGSLEETESDLFLCPAYVALLAITWSQLLDNYKAQGCASCPLIVASGSSSPIFRVLCSRTDEKFNPLFFLSLCSLLLPVETCSKAWEISMETVHREHQQLPQICHRFVFHSLNSFYFFTAAFGHQVRPFCLVYFFSLLSQDF